jgi:hypothetical protein
MFWREYEKLTVSEKLAYKLYIVAVLAVICIAWFGLGD